MPARQFSTILVSLYFLKQRSTRNGENHLLIEYVEKNYEQYSGLLLEKYFRELIAEEEEVTDVGNYWDKNGENEIDLIALNRFNKTALIGEVKRNPRK